MVLGRSRLKSLTLTSELSRNDLKTAEQGSTLRRWTRVGAVLMAIALVTTSCGFDTDGFINDMNDQFEDEGEIYYDPNCSDSDGDGWCD